MSTVIIGGGDDARARIQALETASLTATAKGWRDDAEQVLADFIADCDSLLANAS